MYAYIYTYKCINLTWRGSVSLMCHMKCNKKTSCQHFTTK